MITYSVIGELDNITNVKETYIISGIAKGIKMTDKDYIHRGKIAQNIEKENKDDKIKRLEKEIQELHIELLTAKKKLEAFEQG
jgi:hypothetical protein